MERRYWNHSFDEIKALLRKPFCSWKEFSLRQSMLPISRAGNFPQTMYFLHLHVWNGPFREVTKLKITVRMNYAPVSAYRMNSFRPQSMNEGTTMKIKFHRIDEWSMKVCVDRSGYECSSEWSIWSTFRRSDLVNVFYFSPTEEHTHILAPDSPLIARLYLRTRQTLTEVRFTVYL